MIFKLKRGLLVAGIAAFTAITSSAAMASGAPPLDQTCAATNGFVVPAGGSVNIAVTEGDVLRFTPAVNGDNARAGLLREDGSNVGFAGGDIDTVRVGASVPAFTVFSVSTAEGSTITVTCDPGGVARTAETNSETTRNTAAATTGATSQSGAITTGSSRASQDQFGGGSGVGVTRSSVFMSSQGLANDQDFARSADWNAWISAETRSFSGGSDGDSFDIVAGIGNRVNNDLIIGALLAYGVNDLNVGGVRIESTSPALGVYMAQRFGDALVFDGAYSVARPDYETGGASFTATRHMLSLSLRGEHAMGRINLRPFARLSAFRENQPSYSSTAGVIAANRIDVATLSLGARLSPLQAYSNGIMPYVSLATDFAHRDTTLGGSENMTSPRLGFGMSMDLENGFLNADLDGGRLFDRTDDIGIRVSYEWNF